MLITDTVSLHDFSGSKQSRLLPGAEEHPGNAHQEDLSLPGTLALTSNSVLWT